MHGSARVPGEGADHRGHLVDLVEQAHVGEVAVAHAVPEPVVGARRRAGRGQRSGDGHPQAVAAGARVAEAVDEQRRGGAGSHGAVLPAAEGESAVVELERGDPAGGPGHQLRRSANPAGRSPGAVSTTVSSSAPTNSSSVMCANSGTT